MPKMTSAMYTMIPMVIQVAAPTPVYMPAEQFDPLPPVWKSTSELSERGNSRRAGREVLICTQAPAASRLNDPHWQAPAQANK